MGWCLPTVQWTASRWGGGSGYGLRHVNFSQADLPVIANEALDRSVLHEQESEIFLYDLFVLD